MTTRATRKRAAVVYAVDDSSESEGEAPPPKTKRGKSEEDPDFEEINESNTKVKPQRTSKKRPAKETKKKSPSKKAKIVESDDEFSKDTKDGLLNNGLDTENDVKNEEDLEQDLETNSTKRKTTAKKAGVSKRNTKKDIEKVEKEDNDSDCAYKSESEEDSKENVKANSTKPIKESKTKGVKKASNATTKKEEKFNFKQGLSNSSWQVNELLAEIENIDHRSARNIVSLFEDENTIPFICRYRRDMIRDDLNAERLRQIKITYNHILELRKKAHSIVNQLEKDNILTENTRHQMLCAKSMEELEFLYAPYKPASKGSLLDKAISLGLERPAAYILDGLAPPLHLEAFINMSNPELDSMEKVTTGICHIISHDLSKCTEVLEEMRRLQKFHRIILKSTKVKATKEPKKDTKKDIKKPEKKEVKGPTKIDELKYENYFNFQNDVRYIKPHQILAINRGEKAKVLSVKIEIPDPLEHKLKCFIHQKFFSKGYFYPLRANVLQKAYEECYSKKIKPLMVRQIRSNLNDQAKQAAIKVFAQNLKQLLMMSPLKGEKILGIDPGFSNGCKLALISETADLLETDVIYPHSKYGNSDEWAYKLKKMLVSHGCHIIAIGNGTACRETEFWITTLYNDGFLDPEQVKYCIISEQGASVYSCSEIAKKEFPKLDVNLISAASIARRLNDPLSEYVKIEPKHIGVGMYQHDMNDKALTETLNEVVSECVSFVGVDINTVSVVALKHIAGMSNSRAEKVIEHRSKNGMFHSRKDLLKVKTIGEKTFTQCAGFIRIEPLTVGDSVNINLLDCTWIHPESYDVAKSIISKNNLRVKDIGKEEFIRKMKTYSSTCNLEQLETEFKVPKERLQTVLNALQRELLKDYRSDFGKKPLFKQGITKITELRKGTVVTGAVTNITHFGAFVDIGVDTDGLIHVSNMNGMVLSIGDRVEPIVLDVDVNRNRIQLKIQDNM